MTENPYPGPRPFVAGERLYGRDREITRLFYLLSAERIVVLHSPSGAGKSSLVNAALLPRLAAEGFDVWPAIRLSQPAANGGNRFVQSALASLEEGLPARHRRPAEEIAGQTLAGYVAGRPRRPGAPPSVVLVFDQFEEILTLDPLAVDARQEFFHQLGEALDNPDTWALFALREDFLGALDPYRDDVPTRLGNTFRIDLLGTDAAREAIVGPAHDGGREFEPDAAQQLVEDLSRVKVQAPDGSFEEQTGIYVEPLQLQVVCRRLWDELAADDRTIGVDDLQQSGDVSAALAAYYDASVADIAPDEPAQRAVREWFDDKLITPAEIRGVVLREQGASGGLGNDEIDRLVGTHLVRSEERDGKTWYELAHDRLVAPVRASNLAWFEKNLQPIQRQAALWEQERRPDRLLLRGRDLQEAERWAAANPTRPIERDLLERSARQRRAERRRRLTWGLIVVALGIVSVSIGVLWRNARQAEHRASREARSAESRALAANARPLFDANLDQALPLALRAREEADTPDARGTLVTAAQRTDGLVRLLRFKDGVSALAVDRGRIAVVSNDGTIRLLRPGRGPVVEAGTLRGAPSAIALAPGLPLLAVGQPRLRLLRETGGEFRSLPGKGLGRTAASDSIAVSPADEHGRWFLAAADENGDLRVWQFAGGRPVKAISVAQAPGAEDSGYKSVAFGFGGRQSLVALEDDGGGLYEWDLGRLGRAPRQILESAPFDTGPVAVGPHVAAGDPGEGLMLWRSPHARPKPVCRGGSVSELAFNSAGTVLACGMGDGSVSLWDVASARPLGSPLRGQFGDPVSLAFVPGTPLLVVGSTDGTVAVWDTKSRLGQLRTGARFGQGLDSAVFRQDGKIVVLTDGGASMNASDAIFTEPEGGIPDRLVASADGRKVLLVPLFGRFASGDLFAGRLRPGGPVARPQNHEDAPDASISNDGDVVMATGPRVKRWGPGWSPLPSLDLPSGLSDARVVAVSPDGRGVAALATARNGADKVVLWRRSAAGRGPVLLGTAGTTPTRLVFSPDGSLLAGSGDPQGTIELWHVGGSPTREVLRGHQGAVDDLAVSPDGRMLASGGHDGTVRLWDARDGGQLGEPLVFDRAVKTVAFSAAGDRLLAVHGGGLTVWDATRWVQADDEARSGSLDRLARRLCTTVWPRPAACADGALRFPSGS